MKEDNKLVSVIVPIYKTEKYLPKCIESILNQTYSNIECILVNDGSPGNASKICANYAKKDSRVKYLSQVNSGVSTARNYGIKEARGDYLLFIDSDDYIAPSYVSSLYYALVATNSSLSMCNIVRKTPDKEAIMQDFSFLSSAKYSSSITLPSSS